MCVFKQIYRWQCPDRCLEKKTTKKILKNVEKESEKKVLTINYMTECIVVSKRGNQNAWDSNWRHQNQTGTQM